MFFWDAHQWCYSWKLKEKAKWSMQLVDFIILQKIICQKVGKMCFFSLKMSFPAYVFHYGKLKNWEKRWKKKKESSTCIYYLAYFSSSLGGVSIGKMLANYTTKFEASLLHNVVWEPNFEGYKFQFRVVKSDPKLGLIFGTETL